MDSPAVVNALSALAQEHRLALFRLLVQAGEQGMSAGEIADALGIPNSSSSFHLAALTKAGLIRKERHSRWLIYSADYTAMNALVGYLMDTGGAECSTSAREAEAGQEGREHEAPACACRSEQPRSVNSVLLDAVRGGANSEEGRLCEVDARRSARELRHLQAGQHSSKGIQQPRRSGRETRTSLPRYMVASKRLIPTGPLTRRPHHLLLREV